MACLSNSLTDGSPSLITRRACKVSTLRVADLRPQVTLGWWMFVIASCTAIQTHTSPPTSHSASSYKSAGFRISAVGRLLAMRCYYNETWRSSRLLKNVDAHGGG